MFEFSDDEDFANFDLDAAVASAKQASRPPNLPTPLSMQNSHPNVAAVASNAVAVGQTKRATMGHVDSNGNNKKFKTAEQDNNDQEQEALLFSNELIAIPDEFKVAMTNTLQYLNSLHRSIFFI